MRAKYIAEHYLTDVICYSQVRGMNGYTGYYNGKKVSVQGSGMGIPSMGIYSYELFNTFGVNQIIRVGTCGAVNRDVEVGSLILAMGCCSNSNFASQYHLPGIFAPLADYGLLESAVNQAKNHGKRPFYVGKMYTVPMYFMRIWQAKGQWEKMGVLAQEMETMSYTVPQQSRKESAHHADCRKQHPQQQSPYK